MQLIFECSQASIGDAACLICNTVTKQSSHILCPIFGQVVYDCNGSGALYNLAILHEHIRVGSVIMCINVMTMTISALTLPTLQSQ